MTVKYVSLIVCVALLIAAIVFLPVNMHSGVTAGAGNGTNEKINDPEELLDLLDFIANSGSSDLSIKSTDPLTHSLSVDGSYGSVVKGDNGWEEYDSVTIHENSVSVISSNYSYDGEYSNQKYKLTRQLSIKITEEASYYSSVGYLTSVSTDSDDDGSSVALSFDMEFFIDHDSDETYMKVNNWTMIGNNAISFSEKIIGKWVYFESGVDNIISSVDVLNRDMFDMLGKIIMKAIDDDSFEENGSDRYTISNDDIQAYLGIANAGSDDIDGNCEFSLDFSKADKPKVHMLINAGNSSSGSYGSYGSRYSSKTSVVSQVEYTFEHINNTIVEMNRNEDIIEIDEDDMEDYIEYND